MKKKMRTGEKKFGDWKRKKKVGNWDAPGLGGQNFNAVGYI